MQGYRTYIVAALIAASGVLATTDWMSLFDNPQAGFVALGSGILMALMRSITTGPAGPIKLPGALRASNVVAPFIVGIGLSLGGCANLSPQQKSNLQLEITLAKQIGVDAVQIWCASSNIIYVIANDVNAKARVTTALGKNAKAANDVCPLISTVAGVQVLTAEQARALSVTGG